MSRKDVGKLWRHGDGSHVMDMSVGEDDPPNMDGFVFESKKLRDVPGQKEIKKQGVRILGINYESKMKKKLERQLEITWPFKEERTVGTLELPYYLLHSNDERFEE